MSQSEAFTLKDIHILGQQCCRVEKDVKKTKFNWVSVENVIGFVQWFMNPASSHLAKRKEIPDWLTGKDYIPGRG